MRRLVRDLLYILGNLVRLVIIPAVVVLLMIYVVALVARLVVGWLL